jgi:hypothetical protein
MFTLYTPDMMAEKFGIPDFRSRSPGGPWARRLGASLLIVNREPTPLDGLADAVLHGEAGELLPALVEAGLGATR